MSPYRTSTGVSDNPQRGIVSASRFVAELLVSTAIGATIGQILVACSSQPPSPAGYPSVEDYGQYAVMQATCVAAASTKASADECRSASTIAFCSRFSRSPMCATDGGPDE